MDIVRASSTELRHLWTLLQEYYAAVDVVVRDTEGQVQGLLETEGAAAWLAMRDGEPAGCVVLRPLPELSRAAECKRLYVRPEFRGLGVARRLLSAMEAHAHATGVEWIYLDSKDDLHEALALYRSCGYVDCERYNRNPQATVFLRKRLRS